jgi:glutathione S-transferase
MKLYFAPGSCALAPHIVLCELGLSHATVRVNTKTRQYDGGDYLQVNSKGYVPTLELDDGERLSETAMILQYLADRKPQAGLAPAPGSMDRYRLQEWLNFIATEIHKGFGPLWQSDSRDDEKQRTRDRLAKRFDWLAGQIANRDWVMARRFTIVDAYLFTVLSWSRLTGIDIARRPVLKNYLARVAGRPSVREALDAEGLLKSAEATV